MRKVDATSGPLTKQIFIYAIPLIFTTILQNLFDIADKAVLGNVAGTVAVASVAATTTVTSLIINGAVGLSTGTAIVLARFVGQKNEERIRKAIDTSLLAGGVIGVFIAVVGFFLAPVFLTVTKCPAECYADALLYMRIIIAATPVTLIYNYGAAIVRTLGDSQRPLIYITIAGIVNVGLNVFLCLVLRQKVIAVAIATVASKLISAYLIFRRLCNLEDSARVEVSKMRFDWQSFLLVVRFGIPASISNLVLPLGNLQIATAINSYGSSVLAGHSAAISVEIFAFAFSSGFGSAAMTFIGQNLGARNVERVKKSFWICTVLSTLISGSVGVFTYMTGEIWVGVIVGRASKIAIEHGVLRLLYVAMPMFVNAISNVLIAAMKAFGYPMLTSISNIAINLGFRVFWMQFIYPIYPRYVTIMQCYIVAWLLNLVFYVLFFAFVYRRYVKKGICREI